MPGKLTGKTVAIIVADEFEDVRLVGDSRQETQVRHHRPAGRKVRPHEFNPAIQCLVIGLFRGSRFWRHRGVP